jgi:hypothetical protein
MQLQEDTKHEEERMTRGRTKSDEMLVMVTNKKQTARTKDA